MTMTKYEISTSLSSPQSGFTSPLCDRAFLSALNESLIGFVHDYIQYGPRLLPSTTPYSVSFSSLSGTASADRNLNLELEWYAPVEPETEPAA